jgi:hypothetical protein
LLLPRPRSTKTDCVTFAKAIPAARQFVPLNETNPIERRGVGLVSAMVFNPSSWLHNASEGNNDTNSVLRTVERMLATEFISTRTSGFTAASANARSIS